MEKVNNWSVRAILLDGKGGAKVISDKEIDKWDPKQGKLWIHLDLKNKRAIDWLANNAGLDEWEIETLTDSEESRPRAVFTKDSLLLVLRTINLTPRSEVDDMVFLRLLAHKDKLISVRLHQALDFKKTLELFEGNHGPASIGDLINEILEDSMDLIIDTINDIEDEVDELEEKIIKNNEDINFEDLSELMRKLVTMRRFLYPEKDALDKLTFHKAKWLSKDFDEISRDNYHRISKILEDIDLLKERVRINQEALSSRDMKKSQRNMYMLAIVSTVFLPLTFITGLFGMNVGGIPFAMHEHGLLIIFLFIGGVGGILLYLFRKLKWI